MPDRRPCDAPAWSGRQAGQILPRGTPRTARKVVATMMDFMRIGVAGISPTARKTARRSAEGFDVSLSEPAQTAPANPLQQPTALDALLALQEAQTQEVSDRQGRRHGEESLAALTRLQLALLTQGDSSSAELSRLSALAARVAHSADPALRGLLAAIALRARIELTRRSGG